MTNENLLIMCERFQEKLDKQKEYADAQSCQPELPVGNGKTAEELKKVFAGRVGSLIINNCLAAETTGVVSGLG